MELKNFPTDAEVPKRMMNFGPFIWTALYWSSRDLVQFMENEEIKLIVLLQTQQNWCRISWMRDELWSIYSNSFVLASSDLAQFIDK